MASYSRHNFPAPKRVSGVNRQDPRVSVLSLPDDSQNNLCP
uniref:Uncharacterized protein n=1 Tax=Anguilla anguilla TaxID=7936 RepID=A0A0E9UQ34_ANGAN